jgi:hypothetical protein
MSKTVLTRKQMAALLMAAKAFEWDKMTTKETGLLAWCAFEYYVHRLKADPYERN